MACRFSQRGMEEALEAACDNCPAPQQQLQFYASYASSFLMRESLRERQRQSYSDTNMGACRGGQRDPIACGANGFWTKRHEAYLANVPRRRMHIAKRKFGVPVDAHIAADEHQRSLAHAFDPATMHDGTDHEPTHHRAALMMQGQKQRDGTRNDNTRGCVPEIRHRDHATIKSACRRTLPTWAKTYIAARAKDKHDRVITVSDINDRYAHDDSDVIEIKRAMDSASIALVPIVAANIMRVADVDADRGADGAAGPFGPPAPSSGSQAPPNTSSTTLFSELEASAVTVNRRLQGNGC
jgi:hypothetical protein